MLYKAMSSWLTCLSPYLPFSIGHEHSLAMASASLITAPPPQRGSGHQSEAFPLILSRCSQRSRGPIQPLMHPL